MANVQRSIPSGSIERDFFPPRLTYPGGAQHDIKSPALGDTWPQDLSALEVTKGFYQYADSLFRHFLLVLYQSIDDNRTFHEGLISVSFKI